MKILIIDDDEVILEFLTACLEEGMPGTQVTRYHPPTRGRPGPDFDWSAYDLLLLDYNLGLGDTAVDWLKAYADRPGFPRTLLLTAEESAKVVGNAVRTGADGYLNKSGLTPELLVETVRSMTPAPQAHPAEAQAADESVPTYRGRRDLTTGPGGASYRFTRLIGRGGMSRVYLAERAEDGLTVVLKILDKDLAKDPGNVQRFAREGELMSKIHSPYVAKVYDHGATNSYGYIAMEFFGRGDLQQRMARRVSPEDAVLYLHNIACGLRAIHELGIVHRDLKPGNIMFRGDGSMALVDFGLSKRLGFDQTLTETGVIMGTPYSMSPEQTAGQPADPRSDIYSAGVLFYEMLTGAKPYAAPDLPGLLLQIQSAPVPTLPADLAGYQPLLDAMLAKDPGDRFQDAGELIRALAGYVEGSPP